MDEKTRQLVLNLLHTAEDGAFRSILPELDQLPAEARKGVEVSLQEFTRCLQDRFEGSLLPEAAEARLGALIHGHTEALSVRVMEHYARVLNELLTTSRDRLTRVEKRRDH